MAGDDVISPPTTVLESNGSTSLTQVGNQYYFYDSGGTGPVLNFNGVAVTVGNSGGGWAPIGVEKTASGYQVAWKVAGADTYTIWNTDSTGNFVSGSGVLSGADAALKSAETTLHQDLNGDGVVGAPSGPAATVVESVGLTGLNQVGDGQTGTSVTAANISTHLTEPASDSFVFDPHVLELSQTNGGKDSVVSEFEIGGPTATEQTASDHEVVLAHMETDHSWQPPVPNLHQDWVL